jgi:hypothetical protein
LIEETLFDQLGWSDRDWSRRVCIASMALPYRSVAALLDAGQSVILESPFYEQWDTPQFRGLEDHCGCQFIQSRLLGKRTYAGRRIQQRVATGERHPAHTDDASPDEILDRLLTESWDALDLDGPVFKIDTERDIAAELDVVVPAISSI